MSDATETLSAAEAARKVAMAAVRSVIIEECAQIADRKREGLTNGGAINACRSIASDIRALKGKP